MDAITYVTIPEREYLDMKNGINEIRHFMSSMMASQGPQNLASNIEDKEMYTRKEMAAKMQISIRKLDQILHSGELRTTPIGGGKRILHSDYLEYLKNQRNLGIKK